MRFIEKLMTCDDDDCVKIRVSCNVDLLFLSKYSSAAMYARESFLICPCVCVF